MQRELFTCVQDPMSTDRSKRASKRNNTERRDSEDRTSEDEQSLEASAVRNASAASMERMMEMFLQFQQQADKREAEREAKFHTLLEKFVDREDRALATATRAEEERAKEAARLEEAHIREVQERRVAEKRLREEEARQHREEEERRREERRLSNLRRDTPKMQPMALDEEVEDYLEHFEVYMERIEVPRGGWMTHLWPLLNKSCRLTLKGLPRERQDDYEQVKEVVIAEWTAKRGRPGTTYYNWRRNQGESFKEAFTRLTRFAKRMTKECTTTDQMVDMFNTEFLYSHLPGAVASHVRQLRPRDGHEAALQADLFFADWKTSPDDQRWMKAKSFNSRTTGRRSSLKKHTRPNLIGRKTLSHSLRMPPTSLGNLSSASIVARQATSPADAPTKQSITLPREDLSAGMPS